jgi:hypothetical protein
VSVAVAAAAFTGCGNDRHQAATPPRTRVTQTQVVRWSPFDAAGAVKRTLREKTIEGGCGDASGSETIGGVGYRCTFGHFLAQSCWAAGTGATSSAICATTPWARTVLRLRVGARFVFDEGVTYGAASRLPWALELGSGNRCEIIATGTGPIPTPAGPRTDRYACAHGLNLAVPRRGSTLWTAAAVRLRGGRFGWVGYLPVRRAYFAGLPPGLSRQNRLAARAASLAATVASTRVRRQLGKRRYLVGVHRVRLAFPEVNWSQAGVWVFWGNAGERDVSVVLHRVSGRWRAIASAAVCPTLPRDVRVQLLPAAACRS